MKVFSTTTHVVLQFVNTHFALWSPALLHSLVPLLRDGFHRRNDQRRVKILLQLLPVPHEELISFLLAEVVHDVGILDNGISVIYTSNHAFVDVR